MELDEAIAILLEALRDGRTARYGYDLYAPCRSGSGRPLTAFAGIWTKFKGDRGTKSKPIPGPHLVYGFLVTAPNAVVEPIHPKVMPVILTTPKECRIGPMPCVHTQDINLEIGVPVFHGSSPDDRLQSISKG